MMKSVIFTCNFYKKSLTVLLFLIIPFFLNSCGPFKYKPVDAREVSPNADERVKKNIEEGRGLKIGTSMQMGMGGKGTNFSFASSNPLWRATLEKLDFIPLNNVDYAGGLIITDWYSDTGENEQIKIAVKFLTNEIRSDALDISIFKKVCNELNKCKTNKIESEMNKQIKVSILKRATQLSKEAEKKNDSKKN